MTAPPTWQAAPNPRPNPPQPMPVNAALAGGPARQPTFRAQAPDAPPVATQPLMLPTPEALGLSARDRPPSPPALAPASRFDWNDAQARLRRLGAVGFHLDEIAAGQWRVTVLVPVGNQQSRRIEANATSDAAAVAGALEQAEALAASRN